MTNALNRTNDGRASFTPVSDAEAGQVEGGLEPVKAAIFVGYVVAGGIFGLGFLAGGALAAALYS